ncbi:MAG: SBBP repeat-containing protein, partial [Dehalococcoidia bacterium]
MCKHWVILAVVLGILALVGLATAGCDQLILAPEEDTVAEAWVAKYDGQTADDDGGQALALDGSGNIYVTGYSWGNDTSSDYATMKYDINGNQLWVARYNGPASSEDWALDVTLDSSDNVYVTGWSTGNDTESDYATVKYDSDGNQLWVARYNGPVSGYDLAYAIAVDYSGDIYITGWSQGNSTE